METHHAPAGRDSHEELQRRVAIVQNESLLQMTMDALPTPVAILNEHRQIIAANQALLRMLNVAAVDVIGKRTGEVSGCAYWHDGPDGCGTTKHCLTCGAVAAILESQQNQTRATRECRMTLDTALNGGARDLKVTAAAVSIRGDRFSVCTIEDISDQKRLSVLNRVFFHDVLNTAGGIHGLATLLAGGSHDHTTVETEVHQLGHLAERLIGEIESQRDLTLAEQGDLDVSPEPIHTVELLDDLRALYASHSVAEGRKIQMADVWDGRLITDPRLLARVLGNMLKNALEATDVGGTVTLGCVSEQGRVEFTVHNPSPMPEEVQLQVFHRSFSTKAKSGRGIGTYSMRLLGEHYLGGQVEFASQAAEGTVFRITLPRVLSMLRRA